MSGTEKHCLDGFGPVLDNAYCSVSHLLPFSRHAPLPHSSMSSESTPLLQNGRQNGQADQRLSFAQRVVKAIKAEGEPSWLESYKWFFFGSYTNVLLVFVPLSAVAHNLNWDAALRFSFSFIAIVPLAKVDSESFHCRPCMTFILSASWRRDREYVC